MEAANYLSLKSNLRPGQHSTEKACAEISNIPLNFKNVYDIVGTYNKESKEDPALTKEGFIDKYRDLFFVDRSIVTFHSPEM
jgi:hypothetical protein